MGEGRNGGTRAKLAASISIGDFVVVVVAWSVVARTSASARNPPSRSPPTSRTTSSFQRATLRVERRREEAVVDVEARGGVLVF